MIRILSGSLRGQTIRFKKNPHLRPTADKVRRAIFDTVRELVPGSCVLDLFAGTGSLGIEALSLGAARATFVEHERAQAKTLDGNLERLGVAGSADVVCSNAFEALETLAGEGRTFDLFFVDPPYAGGLGLKAVESVSALGLARPGAVLALEYGKRDDVPPRAGTFELLQKKQYGDTCVAFYRSA